MKSSEPVTVGDLGERALIERITPRFGPSGAGEVWSGDDAAVLGEGLLFTTDLMVSDVDFRLSYCGGFDIGWKLVAINASDIAAMGGRPWRAVAAVSLRPDTTVGFVDELAAGIACACEEWDIGLAGGDFSSGREISASLALIGKAPEGGAVLRSGAKPGDALCVTGALGAAAGGLLALADGAGKDESLKTLTERQLRPRARVAEGLVLGRLVSAMIDVSDGLATDLGHICDASGVGCDVDVDLIPVDPALENLPSQQHPRGPLHLAVTGGEDFELLFAIDEGHLTRAGAGLDELGTPMKKVGVVTEGRRLIGGRDLDDWRAEGWEHLRAR